MGRLLRRLTTSSHRLAVLFLAVLLPSALTLVYSGIAWMPDSRAVIIVNTLKYTEPKHLWLVPIDRGSPRKLDVDIREWKTELGIRLHPSGKQIAFFTGRDRREVWALENVASRSATR